MNGLTVGTLLRACRERRGLSARALSLKAGLSESVVGKIEAGTCEPSLRVFAAIVAALDLAPLEITVLVRVARAQRSEAR